MDNNSGSYAPYIDLGEGLNRLGGNAKLFGMLLKKFADDRSVYENILKASDEDNATDAQFNAHTLKGIVMNLSLKALSDLIVPFEASLKEGIIKKDMIPEIMATYEETLKTITVYLENQQI